MALSLAGGDLRLLGFPPHLAEIRGEGLLSFLQGLDLAWGQGLEVSLLPLQLGPLRADLPEGRLLLRLARLAYRNLPDIDEDDDEDEDDDDENGNHRKGSFPL